MAAAAAAAVAAMAAAVAAVAAAVAAAPGGNPNLANLPASPRAGFAKAKSASGQVSKPSTVTLKHAVQPGPSAIELAQTKLCKHNFLP